MSYIVNKANMVLGIIKMSIGNDSQHMFSNLYMSLVRPILKYAAPFCSPYLIKDIESIEKVERNAPRLVLKQKRGDVNYENHCRVLNSGETSLFWRNKFCLLFLIIS